MKASTRRLLLKLAADFSRPEIDDILKELFAAGRGPTEAFIEGLSELDWASRREASDSPPSRGLRHGSSISVVSDIENLLRREARIPMRTAAEEMLKALRASEKDRRDLLPKDKEAFERWANRLLVRFGAREVLHAATLVRNRFVHGERDLDWSLEQR